MRSNTVLHAVCFLVIATTGVAAAGVGKAANPSPTAQSILFDIKPQPLSSALNALALQSRQQILFTPEIANGKSSQGIKGLLTADVALARLLAGTGLSFSKSADGMVLVSQADAKEASASSGPPSAPAGASNDQSKNTQLTTSRSPQAQSSTSLEEIIVSAQKRDERLQDVPISMNVVTGDEIRERGLVGAEDFLRGMPGVSEVPGYYGDTIVIRGIETSPGYLENFASGTPVATYFGETPTTTSAGMAGGSNIDLKVVDIERVEVLRGPQGTTFGDASLGGAVRVIPTPPKLNQFEGMISAGYSSTTGTGGDNHNVQAVLNLPLINDMVSIRAVGYTFHDSGFIQNVAGSDAKFQAYSASVGQRAVDDSHVGDRIFNGGRVALLFQPTEDLKFTATFLRQTTELDGQPHTGTSDTSTVAFATLGPYQQALPELAPEQTARGQALGILLTDIDLSNATMQYNLGWGDLLATASYIDSSATSVNQLQIAGLPSQRGVGPHHEADGEIRLATKLEGAWNFLIGLYGQKTSDSVLFDYWWFESPTTGLAVFNNGSRDFGYYNDKRDLKQEAVYGEASWKFARDLTLAAGTRVYRYDRSDDVVTTGLLFGDQDSPSTAHASRASWRGNLSYKPNDGVLVYATWSQGFRLGKPQPGLPQDLCGDPNGIVKGTEGTTNVTIASTRIVNSDTIENYELGTKLTLLDRRLSLSADVYRMNWNGLPVSVNAPPAAQGGCALTYVANAGKAKSQGFEFQASYNLTHAFRVDLGGSIVDATLTQDVPSLAAVAGDRLPGSPKVNGTLALQYAFSMIGREAWVRADAAYVGSFYGDLQGTPATEAGGYMTVGMSGGLQVDQHLSVRVAVRNLTNNSHFVFRNFTDTGPNYGYPLQPRTIGVQIESNF